MSEQKGLTPEQLSILLKIVAARTGKDPIMLEQQLAAGSSDDILDALGADREKLRPLTEDKKQMETLLSSPKVRALLKQLLWGSGGLPEDSAGGEA